MYKSCFLAFGEITPHELGLRAIAPSRGTTPLWEGTARDHTLYCGYHAPWGDYRDHSTPEHKLWQFV